MAIESLEARRLMCAEHGEELALALARAAARTSNAAASDHQPAWYQSVGTKVLGTQVPTSSGHSASGDAIPTGVTINVNAAGLPLLSSRADGKGMKVFLDFDGYGSDTPFSTDADGTTFNSSEQVNIYDTWRDIVSYFGPLDLNITTIQPATGGSNPVFVWHRISNSISGGAAYVGWVTNNSSNSWTGADGGTSRHSGIAHEVGHQLGLSHQAEYDVVGNKTDEYSDGFDNRNRPIIGIDFAENIRSWWYGRNSDAVLSLQDDLSTMSNFIAARVGGDGYRADDFGSTLAAASNLPASGMTQGIIERIDDADVFKFTATGGTYQVAATPTFESSASPKLELLDSSGKLIASRDDADRRNTNNNAQEFSLDLDAGTYYVRVASSGDYAEQGEYVVTAAPLPTGWTSQDIGANAIYRAGTAAFDPTAHTLTQLGGGNDIWSTNDQFRFTSATITGDGSITARIDSLDNVDFNAKAGVMIRETTATNSAHVYVGIKPSGQLDPIVRNGTGNTAFTLGNPSGVTAPWVRLTRVGNLFTIERSSDGTNWSTYGTTTVVMGANVQVGFATNSRSPRQATYAKFSGISFSGSLATSSPSFNSLGAPLGLTAVPAAGANTSISLAWSAVTGATGYAIDRSLDGVTFTALTTTAAGVLNFLDANLFGSMRYYYRTAAIGAGSSRSVSSPAVSVINKPNAPTNPSGSYAQAVIRPSGTQLLLNWSDVQGDNGYRIERSTSGGAFSVITTTTRNRNAFNDSGLTSGTSYTYRVTPITTVGDGVASPWTITATTVIATPTNFRSTGHTSGSVSLTWTDVPGESSYRIERSIDASTWSIVGSPAANATTYTDGTAIPLTRYYYRLSAVDSLGIAGAGAVTIAATLAVTPVPAPWTGADVGAVPTAGASTGTAGGTWTVIGAGDDIWGTADQFHYASRELVGDGSIVARLTSLDQTDFYTKAGVMFRESNAANAPYAFMHVSSGPGLQFEYRDATGNSSANGFILASSARWLKLERTGNLFTASYSTDGSSWTVAATQTIAMAGSARAGLAATSHNSSRLTLATFDNVTVVGGGSNTAPTITIAAAAAASPVTAGSTTLSVGASDDGGAANLNYEWTILSKPDGVADPLFGINGTNAASSTNAIFAAAGNYKFRVTVTDVLGLTAVSDVSVPVTLRMLAGTYQYDIARPQLTFAFNADVAASLSPSDLILTNLTTGATVPTGQIQSDVVVAANRAIFTFTAGPNGTLPEGNYRATIRPGDLAEISGQALASAATIDFFVKAGDANHDGKVDFDDLVILSQNYNGTGKTLSGGNLDYDPLGTVNFDDLVLLSQNYNTSLTTIAPLTVAAPKRKPRGTSDVIA